MRNDRKSLRIFVALLGLLIMMIAVLVSVNVDENSFSEISYSA